MVHRRQADALAPLARQRVVDQHVQRLVGRDARRRQTEQNLPDGIQRPDRPSEEPMEHRDVPVSHNPRRQRDCCHRPPPQAMDPPRHHRREIAVARRREAARERAEQAHERLR